MSHDFERDKANGDLDLVESWRAQTIEDRHFAIQVWSVVCFLLVCFWVGVCWAVVKWLG